MTKTSSRLTIISALLLGLVLALVLSASPAYAASALSTAAKKYNIASENVVTVNNANNLSSALAHAGAKATAKSMYAVYVKNGTYSISKPLVVPENVVLVCQSKKTKFVAAKNISNLFSVAGSIYGGAYIAKHQAAYALCFAEQDFTGKKNGQIEKAIVTQASSYGITADSPKTKGVRITSCTAYNCAAAGIAIVNGATASVINTNKVYGNKGMGIYVGDSTVATMKKNNIYSNKGVGLFVTGSSKCVVKRIDSNRIATNSDVGIYVNGKATIAAFVSNKVPANKNSGLCINGGSVVKGFAKNGFSSNAPYNVLIMGKGSAIVLGNSNTLTKPGDSNIVLDERATLTLAGNGNKILHAPRHGIYLNNQSKMAHSSGSNNSIASCKANGIFVNGKSSCSIANMSFSNISSSAVYVAKGSSFSSKNCGLSMSRSVAPSKQVYRA